MIYALILLGIALACLLYVGREIYRGAKAVIEDPDSADLFDGK